MKPVFTRLTALLLAPLAALHAADTPKPYGKSKPNIVIILADDLGYGDVGFNGQVKFKTPNIDKMTRDGVRMANFYSGAPVCGPSRAVLMYGQHTGHNPIRRNPGWTASGKGPQMGVDDIIIPKELKRAGYTTAVIGKWALNDDLKSNTGHPLKQGFDLFYGFNTHGEAHEHWPDFIWDGETKVILNKGIKGGNWTNKYAYADDLFQKKALDYIEQQDAKTPFFMYLNFTIPHKGYSVPQESRLPYENLGWPKEIKGSGYNNDPDANSAYAGMISRMDGYVGEIRAKLEALGIAENTLIIFTSDNGHEFSSNFFNSGGGFKGKKRDLFEGGIHAPTAIVWPKVIKPGTTIESPFAFWDVLPTLCDISGIKPSAKTDGISFLPSLKGDIEGQKNHEYLYWEFGENAGPVQAVRFGNWKAVRLWDKATSSLGDIQLFELKSDMSESSNLAKQHPEIASQALHYMTIARNEDPEYPLTLIRRGNGK